MTGMAWFRMYAEFLHDPKVQMLSEVDQRRFIMLLCIRCCSGDETLHETLDDDFVAFQMRIDVDEWRETKRQLRAKCLVNDEGQPTNWAKRQFASDSSTARVRKHRRRDETVTKRSCHVIDTDTDTDTEEENPLTPFEEFWALWPKKVARKDAVKAWKQLGIRADAWPAIADALRRATASRAWTKDGGEFIPHASTWLNGRRWEDEAAVPIRAKTSPAYVEDEFWKEVI
jgi:hypothetical protein